MLMSLYHSRLLCHWMHLPNPTTPLALIPPLHSHTPLHSSWLMMSRLSLLSNPLLALPLPSLLSPASLPADSSWPRLSCLSSTPLPAVLSLSHTPHLADPSLLMWHMHRSSLSHAPLPTSPSCSSTPLPTNPSCSPTPLPTSPSCSPTPLPANLSLLLLLSPLSPTLLLRDPSLPCQYRLNPLPPLPGLNVCPAHLLNQC